MGNMVPVWFLFLVETKINPHTKRSRTRSHLQWNQSHTKPDPNPAVSCGVGIYIGVLLSAAEVVALALSTLAPDAHAIVESYFLDGYSVAKIMHQQKMKRHEIQAILSAAIEIMRKVLYDRGVTRTSDIL
jgi:hypothetical protein